MICCPSSKRGKIQASFINAREFLLGLVMLGPLFGLLFPPEFLFFLRRAATEFTASGAMAAPHEWITAFATHLTTLFTFFSYLATQRRLLPKPQIRIFDPAAVWRCFSDGHLVSGHPYLTSRILPHFNIVDDSDLCDGSIFSGGIYCSAYALICDLRCFYACSLSCSFRNTAIVWVWFGYENAYRGLFINKNNLGSMCSSAVAFAAYSLLISAGSKRVALLCLGCALVLVVLSRSATSQLLVGFELIFLTIVYLIRSGLGRMVLIAGGG